MFHGIRRASVLVDPHDRRRLQLVALYGILIAALDTVALLLVYALINLLDNQPVTHVAGSAIRALQLNQSDHYRTALILLGITALLAAINKFLCRFMIVCSPRWLRHPGAAGGRIPFDAARAQVRLRGRLEQIEITAHFR